MCPQQGLGHAMPGFHNPEALFETTRTVRIAWWYLCISSPTRQQTAEDLLILVSELVQPRLCSAQVLSKAGEKIR